MRATERPSSRSGAAPRLVLAAVVALSCLAPGFATPVKAKGAYVGAWSLTAGLGYAIPNTDEYDNAFAWRLAAGYSPLPQFAVDLEVGRFASGVDQPEPGGVPVHTVASGELDVFPVCVTAQYRLPVPSLYSTLTLLAGFGYYFIDYAMADEPRGVFAAGGTRDLPDQSVNDAWGLHLGGGIEYSLNERLSLVGEGRYLFLEPGMSGTAALGKPLEGSLDLNTWLLTGSIKVTF